MTREITFLQILIIDLLLSPIIFGALQVLNAKWK